MITISKKQVSKTSIFELSKVKNCISRLGVYQSTAFSEVPNAKRGEEIRSGSLTCLLGDPEEGGIAT